MKKLICSTFREGYGIDQIRRTMTVGSMSMSTRAGADRPTSARSRATPSTVSPATPCRKERSLSLFRHGTHGIFERKARWPRASASLAAVGELQHALYIAGG